VLRDLPDKILFLFAQRPDDVMAKSPEFAALSNVTRIPEAPLDVLGQQGGGDFSRRARAIARTRTAP